MNEAFEQVVRKESGRLYALCFRLTGQEQEAEDLLHDALVAAYKGFERFQGRSQISTWLYRIALNVWKNKIRAKKRRPLFQLFQFKSDDQNERGLPEPVGPDLSPEINIEKMESSQLLQSVLMTMDEEDREIIILRDVDDKTYEEMATLLELPLGTVKSRLARAREALRARLVPLLKRRGEWS